MNDNKEGSITVLGIMIYISSLINNKIFTSAPTQQHTALHVFFASNTHHRLFMAPGLKGTFSL